MIGTLEAVDRDGTEPGNIVRFELGNQRIIFMNQIKQDQILQGNIKLITFNQNLASVPLILMNPEHYIVWFIGEDSSESSTRYFTIDQISGQIKLLDDLRNIYILLCILFFCWQPFFFAARLSLFIADMHFCIVCSHFDY